MIPFGLAFAVAGFVLGLWVGDPDQTSPPGTIAAHAPASMPSPPAPTRSPRQVPSSPRHVTASAPTAAAGAEASVDMGEPIASLEELHATNRALTEQVARLRAELSAIQAERGGGPDDKIAFPDDLGDQFRQPGLVTSFTGALAAANMKGEVLAVDCSEFPCLVHGRIDDAAQDALHKLMNVAKRQYPGAEMYASRSRFEGDDGRAVELFSATFYPGEVEGIDRELLNKRMRSRKNDYADASHDQRSTKR